MPTRYQCSDCKGTFDVEIGAPAPKCPKGDGAMPEVGRTLVPPTGCLYGAEAFNRQRFQYLHFVPSTGRGKFDIDYRPMTGIFTVTVKFGVEYVDPGTFSWFGSKEKAALQESFGESVQRYWDNKCQIQCTQVGWTNIVVRPRFRVEFGTLVGAHFRMVISREDSRTRDSGSRECRGFVSLNQVTTNDPTVQDRIELRDFQIRDFNHGVGGLQTAGKDSQFLEKAIETSGMPNRKVDARVTSDRGPLDVRQVVGDLGFADNASDFGASLAQITKFAADVNRQLPGSHPVPIQIKGFAKPTETSPATLAAARAQAVRTFLTTTRRIPNPIEVLTPVGSGKAAVEISVDQDFEWSFKRGERPFEYNVAAHEFGHLIGLPDEYENPEGGPGATADAAAKAKVKTNFLALTERTGSPRPRSLRTRPA